MIHEGAINIPFTYAAGEAGTRFLKALRDDRQLLGSHCTVCDFTCCPGRECCPRCGADEVSWVQVGPAGGITAKTAVADKGAFVLVRLDGADTAMLHRLLTDADACPVGARVRPQFSENRVGSICDLEGFVVDAEANA